MANILSCQHLTVRYGSTLALEDISWQVAAGEYVGVVGDNGSGKSTLIRVLLGLVPKTEGALEIFGQSLRHFQAWQKIGYVPQSVVSANTLFPATVQEVVGLGLLSTKHFPKRLSTKDNLLVKKSLQEFGIAELASKQVRTLSGGQQQRVFLAKALITNPELLILDEPGTALDSASREHFFQLVAQQHQERKVAVVLITHDFGEVEEYADSVLFLQRKVVFQGKVSEFMQDSLENSKKVVRSHRDHWHHQHTE